MIGRAAGGPGEEQGRTEADDEDSATLNIDLARAR